MAAKTHSPMSDGGPVEIKRGDLRGLALATYVPRRNRGARHYQDAFSCALWLAKLNVPLPNGEGAGAAYAPVWGEQIADLARQIAPEGVDAIVYPPMSSTRAARGWYLAQALATQTAAQLGVPVLGCLSWAAQGQEASKEIVHQNGKGRALAKRAICAVRLDGMKVLLCDDMATTLITATRCAEALQEAGAEVLGLVTLGATERTRDRPAEERERIAARAERRRVRKGGAECNTTITD